MGAGGDSRYAQDFKRLIVCVFPAKASAGISKNRSNPFLIIFSFLILR
jgi:hypothetical protein